MSNKVKIELSHKYAEHLDLLKEIIPNSKWEEITDNSEMVEVLIDSFMSFIEEQALLNDEEWSCCSNEWHDHNHEEHHHDHKHEDKKDSCCGGHWHCH